MSWWSLVVRSFVFFGRMNAVVGAGVAAATAVLTGALLVGDSMRGSLRELTLERLGRIDEALVAPRYFRAALADELERHPEFAADFSRAVPIILLPQATAERRSGSDARRASGITVVGCRDDFWQLAARGSTPQRLPADGDVILNEPLASELGVRAGDEVTLRLGSAEAIPADTPLGNKDDLIRSLVGLRVIEILPAEGLGRFSLQANQALPRNAYVALDRIQEVLEQPAKANALLVAGRQPTVPPTADADQRLARLLSPQLEDYGLRWKRARLTYREAADAAELTIFDYNSLISERMILEPEAARVGLTALAGNRAQAVFTYLANLLERVPSAGESGGRPGIPYSLIASIDFTADFQLLDLTGQPIGVLAADEIVLTSWAADDLGARPGDRIRLAYFAPETTHGDAPEQHVELRVKAITPLTEPAQPYLPEQRAVFDRRPTVANDPDLTPEVRGVTDQKSIGDWEVPFTVDYRRLRSQDDSYWENHTTTPKAYVALATGQRLWGSRFGDTTSLRVPLPPGTDEVEFTRRLLAQLRADDGRLGLTFQPVKREQLQASAGTTAFDALFLALGFFIIAAALMLIALLFRLGVEQRARELGTLLAMGFRRRRVARLLVGEGLLVAACGGLVGVAVGIGYAWLMVTGLRTWWVGAIQTPFLEFHGSWTSLVVGYLLGVLVSAVTIVVSVWQTTRAASIRRLLAGQASADRTTGNGSAWGWNALAAGLLATAGGLAILATRLGGDAQAGCFVGAGFCVLIALLLVVRNRLRKPSRRGAAYSLWRLVLANAGRNPGRSTISIGLIAVASFLILAMSAFRLDPTREGAGDMDLVATSSAPLFADFGDPATRESVFPDAPATLDGVDILSLRLQPGDDASCSNLYQSFQPRVLGVPAALAEYYNRSDVTPFDWAGSAGATDADHHNPWRLLGTATATDGVAIPVVLDKNTAMYSLHKYGGIGEEFSFSYDGRSIRFRVVGLLANSVLQGSLLVGEADFKRQFPGISGYRYFLVRAPRDRVDVVERGLETAFSEQGFDAQRTDVVLRNLLAVQNTYLSTFQSLGALGLLLGTFGLAAVQVRNVVERRGELALLSAAGFGRRRIGQLVLLENLLLLLGGLGIGAAAALLAILPHAWSGGAAVPLASLVGMLATVLAVGLLTSLLAVRATLRAPLVAALRGE